VGIRLVCQLMRCQPIQPSGFAPKGPRIVGPPLKLASARGFAAPSRGGKCEMRILEIVMNTERFQQRLLDRKRELEGEMARLEDEARDAGEEQVRDPTDDATFSQGASQALQEESLASQTLTLVLDALKRIDSGTYGNCIACGRKIEAARLEAVPWAAYCLEDQAKLEKATRAAQGGFTL